MRKDYYGSICAARYIEGLKFRRQQPIENYIVDFVCFEKKIVIEVDGGQHAVEKEKDTERDRWLESQGFKVLRFWNNDVLTNIQGVLEMVKTNCLRQAITTSPFPNPSDRNPPTSVLPRKWGEDVERGQGRGK